MWNILWFMVLVACCLGDDGLRKINPEAKKALEIIQKENFVHESALTGSYLEFVPKPLRWELAFVLSFELRLKALDEDGLKKIQHAFVMDDLNTIIVKKNLTQLQDKIYPFDRNLTTVTSLDLSQNQIDHIDRDAFRGLQNLVSLRLDYNEISHMTGVFWPLGKLKYLSLHSNKLQSVEALGFPENSSLEEVFLINNRITNLPEGSFKNLRNLHNLHLSKNTIRTLHSGAFRGLSSLQYLFLRENCIPTLPHDIFEGLSQLSHVDLEQNLLEFIDSRLFASNENLFSVLLTQNRLTSLHPDFLVHIKSLQSIMLDENQLVEYNFSGIHTTLIRLSGNHLTELQFNPNVTHIQANGNKIERILVPSTMNLLDLQVDSNKIVNLTNITTITTLVSLSVANNSISELPEDFQKLTQLLTLDLSNNHLSVLSFSLWTTNFSLPNVYDLRINGNNLSHLPTNFLDFFPNLQFLYLCGNPWESSFLENFTAECSRKNITINNPKDLSSKCSN